MTNNVKGTPIVKGLGFNSFGIGTNACTVDIDEEQDKILRIRPLHFDEHYTPEQMNAWTIHARGSEYRASMKSLIPPFSLVYKKRAYSTNRILHPLKRVDLDPNGERHPENRGKSKFERISWDEALDILVSEIRRIHDAVRTLFHLLPNRRPWRDEDRPCRTWLPDEPSRPVRRLHVPGRQPDSWEGWHWGAKHVWGHGRRSARARCRTTSSMDVAQNADALLLLGLRRGDHPRGRGSGYQASRLCYWFTELGIKQVHVASRRELRRTPCTPTSGFPSSPNTDAALAAGHRLHVARRRHLRPGVPGHPRLVGYDELQVTTCMGERGRRAQNAQVGRRPSAAFPQLHRSRRLPALLACQARTCPSRTATAAPSSAPSILTSRRAWKFWPCACRPSASPVAT